MTTAYDKLCQSSSLVAAYDKLFDCLSNLLGKNVLDQLGKEHRDNIATLLNKICDEMDMLPIEPTECPYCHEKYDSIEAAPSTWQQWQCVACRNWVDKTLERSS